MQADKRARPILYISIAVLLALWLMEHLHIATVGLIGTLSLWIALALSAGIGRVIVGKIETGSAHGCNDADPRADFCGVHDLRYDPRRVVAAVTPTSG